MTEQPRDEHGRWHAADIVEDTFVVKDYATGKTITDVDELRRFKQQDAARMFDVPDRYVGIDTPWWKHWWQVHVTRRG